MSAPRLVLLAACTAVAAAQNERYVTVSTPQGAMQGVRVDYGSDTSNLYYGNAYCFLGVPYAQAPTGQLRFSEPVAVPSSTRTYDATYMRSRCPQPGSASGSISEDCLYLNIITAQMGNTTALSAVMVFIGGEQGFTQGGTDEAEIAGTIRNLCSRGVVVVTVQYRLGALGFFNLENSGVPQNLGMLDQVMALQWIQANIQQFGGDPNRITLCGSEDGACAVAAHAVSPMSEGLFQQAILQSGSIYTCYQDTNQQTTLPPTTTLPTLRYNEGAQYQPINQQTAAYYSPTTTTARPTTTTAFRMTTTTTTTARYTTATAAQGSAAVDDVSSQIAYTMCNITSDQLSAGYSNARLRTCLQSLTVDVFVNFSGSTTSRWVIVRDNSFMPGSPEALAQANPRSIPMIIGTVEDEDAEYAFRMIADGTATNKSEEELYNGWFVDFAKRNKINGSDAEQVKTIISDGYGISETGTTMAAQQQPYTTTRNYQTVGQPSSQTYNYNTQGYTTATTPSSIYYTQPYYNPSYNQQAYSTQPYSNQNYNTQPYYNQNYNTQNYNTGTTQQANSGYQYTNMQYTQINNGNGTGVVNQQTLQYLDVITQISSDAYGVSQSVSQVNLVQQQGSETRIYQFTHVTELGRSTQPNTGAWKPVYRGTDNYFLFMSESIWTTGNPTQADLRVANEMGSMWTDFAKTGQVDGWQSSPSGQYNYCNVNTQPTMQADYGSQARQVFNEQVYPIVEQATNSAPFNPSTASSTTASQQANVMVHNNNGGSSWSVSFSLPAAALYPYK